MSRAQANRSEDKRYLKDITAEMKVSDKRIKLDGCGDWNIVGKSSHIFTDTKAWYLYISPQSSIKWNNLKKKLKFMEVSQDGDDEGILRLRRLPTSKEAESVRKVMKIRRPSMPVNLQNKPTSEGVF